MHEKHEKKIDPHPQPITTHSGCLAAEKSVQTIHFFCADHSEVFRLGSYFRPDGPLQSPPPRSPHSSRALVRGPYSNGVPLVLFPRVEIGGKG